MNPIEVIAVLFALAILADVIWVMTQKPSKIMGVVKKVYPNTLQVSAVMVVVLVVVGFFLLKEMTVAQIAAAALFGMVLYGLILVQYPNQLIKLSAYVLKNPARAYFPWLLFVVGAICVLVSVF